MRAHKNHLLGQVALLCLVAALACGDDGAAGSPDAAAQLVDSGVVTDELSMPATPTLSLDDFMGSDTCGSCHATHHEQWKTSMHSYAMTDPVYKAIVRVRQEEFGGEQDRFCLQCHSPIGTRAGDIQPGFDFDALAPMTQEGVNCETCHAIEAVARPYNAGMALSTDGAMRGPIADPISNPAHESEHSPLFDSSLLCASCHDVIEVSGLNLERPYQEWLESPAALAGIDCQSCHMETYVGKATSDGPERELHEHYFVGVDLPLEDDYLPDQAAYDALRQRIAALLEGSATVELRAQPVAAGEQIDLFVSLRNNIVAHNIPTGSTFNRQVWLEVIARDANGATIYETGTLDANGDLRNYWSELDSLGDHDLLEFGSRFTDITGTPEIFPWRATEHHSNSISPLYERTHTLFVPTLSDTPGPVHIEARLRFRSFPPFLLRALSLSEKIDKLEIFDIDSISIDVDVAAP